MPRSAYRTCRAVIALSRRPAGLPLQDIWTDIRPIHNLARERLGYATQKPLPLLTRIIEASSNPGDTVFDPFCGCATTIEAAHNLGRRWIGVDIAIHAIRSRRRLVQGRAGQCAPPFTGNRAVRPQIRQQIHRPTDSGITIDDAPRGFGIRAAHKPVGRTLSRRCQYRGADCAELGRSAVSVRATPLFGYRWARYHSRRQQAPTPGCGGQDLALQDARPDRQASARRAQTSRAQAL